MAILNMVVLVAVDARFGSDGIATIATVASTTGLNLAIGADGTIISDAQSQTASSSKLLLTRLTARGAADPTFAGGTPATVSSLSQNTFGRFRDSQLLRRADGSYLVAGAVQVSQPTCSFSS